MQASRRYATVVVVLAAARGGGFLAMLGSAPLRSFFALTVPGLWAVIVIAATGVGAVWALARLGLSPYRRSEVPEPASSAERSA
jgi:hypothetical protein